MLRIVVCVPGPGDPVEGAAIVARALRDAGHEIIHAGGRQTAEQIAETAIQEDADLVGLAVPSGGHLAEFGSLVAALADRDAPDIGVFALGSFPETDLATLAELGVARIFSPGESAGDVVGWVAGWVAEVSQEPA